jgi:hypothetical protein
MFLTADLKKEIPDGF